jgi:chemotaxis response regulator CheB
MSVSDDKQPRTKAAPRRLRAAASRRAPAAAPGVAAALDGAKPDGARPPEPNKSDRIELQAPRVEPADAEPHASPQATPFPVVGIGASAGGLAAFEAFFAAMPVGDETGMAFVLVQHLSPTTRACWSS